MIGFICGGRGIYSHSVKISSTIQKPFAELSLTIVLKKCGSENKCKVMNDQVLYPFACVLCLFQTINNTHTISWKNVKQILSKIQTILKINLTKTNK